MVHSFRTYHIRHALNGGELINITFPGEDLTIYQSIANPEALPHSYDIYFDEVAEHMEEHKHDWEKVTRWAALAFNDMLDGNPVVSDIHG
jgi:hypothetical protein